MKVKEKMEQESSEVLKRKEDMEKMREDIKRTHAEETRTLQEILSQQQQEKERTFAEQQVKEEKERQKNKLLEELELMRRIRAQEVLQELSRRGIKKIGNAKISDMERRGDYDYDDIMNYYQGLLKREKEAFEGEKQKKLKDVEYWARAVREEERVATEKYAKEHGEEEMKQIQRAVKERHERELKMKQALDKAQGSIASFKAVIMRQREDLHEEKMQMFVQKKGEELQVKIIEEAKSELRRIENIRKVKEAEEKRKRQTEEKEKQLKLEGKFTAPGEEDAPGGWSRATAKQPVDDRPPRKEEGGAPVMTRAGFGKAAPEEKKEEGGPKRPTFTKQIKKDEPTGPAMTRSGMGTAAPTPAPPRKTEEEKKPAAEGGFAGPWRSSGPQNKQGEPKFGAT